MFSIARSYNSVYSYSVIPIRVYLIMMSIVFHHYKTLNESVMFVKEENNYNNNSAILQRKLDKWDSFSSILRKPNRDLFNRMLQSSYKYSNAIDAKGEQFLTESLIISLLVEQHKIKKIIKTVFSIVKR